MNIEVGKCYRANYTTTLIWAWRVDDVSNGMVWTTTLADPRKDRIHERAAFTLAWFKENATEIYSFKQQLKELL